VRFKIQNKLVESTDHEAGLSDATSAEVWSQNSDEGSGSKAEMRKFHDVWKSEFLWLSNPQMWVFWSHCIALNG
jgi:hypothetical protein